MDHHRSVFPQRFELALLFDGAGDEWGAGVGVSLWDPASMSPQPSPKRDTKRDPKPETGDPRTDPGAIHRPKPAIRYHPIGDPQPETRESIATRGGIRGQTQAAALPRYSSSHSSNRA